MDEKGLENYILFFRKGGSIQTFSGIIYHPLDPRPEDINLVDVAHSLANTSRFTGHCRTHYSTGEHAVRVSWRVRDNGGTLMQQYVALHHDDSDAYLPDVPTPLKVLPEFEWFRLIEKSNQEACFQAFGCVVDDYSIIKKADTELLLTEKRDLMPLRNGNWKIKYKESPIPRPYQIIPWTTEEVKQRYIERHNELVHSLSLSLPQSFHFRRLQYNIGTEFPGF